MEEYTTTTPQQTVALMQRQYSQESNPNQQRILHDQALEILLNSERATNKQKYIALMATVPAGLLSGFSYGLLSMYQQFVQYQIAFAHLGKDLRIKFSEYKHKALHAVKKELIEYDTNMHILNINTMGLSSFVGDKIIDSHGKDQCRLKLT